MNFTLAPESFSELRIFCPARPGSITAASRLESSTTRYALFLSGGAVNVVTRIGRWIRGRDIKLSVERNPPEGLEDLQAGEPLFAPCIETYRSEGRGPPLI